MIEKKLTVIHPPRCRVALDAQESIFCPDDQCFVMDENQDFVFLAAEMQRMRREIEYQRKRYLNVLKGLQYWKGQADEKTSKDQDM